MAPPFPSSDIREDAALLLEGDDSELDTDQHQEIRSSYPWRSVPSRTSTSRARGAGVLLSSLGAAVVLLASRGDRLFGQPSQPLDDETRGGELLRLNGAMGDEATACHTSEEGEQCMVHIKWAMTDGVFAHPEWYGGLTTKDSAIAFQAVIHQINSTRCPHPCGIPAPATVDPTKHAAVEGTDHVIRVGADIEAATSPSSATQSFPAPGECSAPGQDCRLTQCCTQRGFQCYEKNSWFASCHDACSTGSLGEDGVPWSCKKLGPRNGECSTAGDNCNRTLCCKQDGYQCYVKNKFFATCRKECEPGHRDPLDERIWSCDKLGDRAGGSLSQCQWPASDCSISKCCKLPNFRCYKKDNHFASCKRSCTKGLNPKDNNAIWDCTELGGPNMTYLVASAPVPEPHPAMGTSLFCVTVVLPHSNEEQLRAEQESRGLGVFSKDCDGHHVLAGELVSKGEWQSAANAGLFIKLWRQIEAEGRYKNYDWTVKVDLDAVFFPDRLKLHLQKTRAPPGSAVYLKNCGFKFGFMGSLEILTQAAVQMYFDNIEDCSKHIGHDGGEDYYLMTCLDAIGVGSMVDMSLLRDRYDSNKFPGKFSLYGLEDCSNSWSAAFHPHKSWDNWEACYNIAVSPATVL